MKEKYIEANPAKKNLSQVLAEIGRDDELADRIKASSRKMRRSKMRDAES